MFHFIKKGKIYEDKLSLYICVKYTFQINVFKKEKKTQNKLTKKHQAPAASRGNLINPLKTRRLNAIRLF